MDIQEIHEMLSKATPGPWRWELNLQSKIIQLNGGFPTYDLCVMGFDRWGMSGAIPLFMKERRPNLQIKEKAFNFAKIVEGREHHSSWFQTIDQPDANLIAQAPEIIKFLLQEVERLKGLANDQ